ncbi:MAG: hypothetical protein HRU48_23290 [Vibrio sp.]|jgi:hypothetical protein|uniref:hypothetical protein n=1 Tax=Vibrio sp. TaxID=678 RepID=UPI001EBC8BCD|nr:hypothetical protein [Vibrio sp.]NRB70235.1 hypothetical protein [Vibrio sp.]
MVFDSAYSQMDEASINLLALRILNIKNASNNWNAAGEILSTDSSISVSNGKAGVVMYGDSYLITPSGNLCRDIIEARLVSKTTNTIPSEFSVEKTVSVTISEKHKNHMQ